MNKWQKELQQYPDGWHVCIADAKGNWIADCGIATSKQSHNTCKSLLTAANNHAALIDALENCAGWLSELSSAFYDSSMTVKRDALLVDRKVAQKLILKLKKS